MVGITKKNANLKNIILLCALILIIPFFVQSGYFLSILIFVAIHAIIVLGLVLLIGYTGQVSMGHAGFFAVGAYTSAILSTTYGLSPWISMIVAVIFSMLMALIVGFATLRIKGHYLALATLAFGLIVYRLIFSLEKITGGTSGIRDIPHLSLGNKIMRSDLQYYFVVWVFVLVIFIIINNITRSPFGLFMRGVHTDEVAVSVVGINVFVLKLKILLFSAAMAGIAGSLYAHYVTYISPDVFTIDRSILLLMMVIIGGSQYPWGGLIGSVLLILLPEFLRAYKDLAIGAYGIIAVLILLYLPGGIASITTLIRGLKWKTKGTN